MHPLEQTRVALGNGFLVGEWTFPAHYSASNRGTTRPPYAALLLLAPRDCPVAPASFLHELTHELARQSVSVWQAQRVDWSTEAVLAAWVACAQHPLISRVRVGLVAFGAAGQALQSAQPLLRDPRPPLVALVLPAPAAEANAPASSANASAGAAQATANTNLAALLPSPDVQSRAIEDRRAAVALCAHVYAQLLPTWEQAARRPGTAIG